MCAARADSVTCFDSHRRHSDYGANTKHGPRAAARDILAAERRVEDAFALWALVDGLAYRLTDVGEALRASCGVDDETTRIIIA